ncbi:MAG: hypothetical protein GWP69_22405 [Gammaproteobacteria bacterium]|jgi:hypothetical protein|nr:hypothetical protein [Gammaproteobacteria bacterium]
MTTNSLEACERAQAIDYSKAQEDLWFSGDDEVSQGHLLWIPEDIAEPEPWTLASFDDLLTHEMG